MRKTEKESFLDNLKEALILSRLLGREWRVEEERTIDSYAGMLEKELIILKKVMKSELDDYSYYAPKDIL